VHSTVVGPEKPASYRQGATSHSKPIVIFDRSGANEENEGAFDGLWASSVEVSHPSIVHGTQSTTFQAVSSYVGETHYLTLIDSLALYCANF
jgi:hypothetical protein